MYIDGYSLQSNNVHNKGDHFEDRKDNHGHGWWAECHASLVLAICKYYIINVFEWRAREGE